MIPDPSIAPIIIFILRVMNNAIGTIRLIAMTRGHTGWGFLLASIESLMFAYTAGIVLVELDNLPNLTAYVLGFATGGYVGMLIEYRFHHTFNTVTVIMETVLAHQVAAVLREGGHGVTETHGEGARGEVSILRIVVEHKLLKDVLHSIRDIKPDAFVTVEQAQQIHYGWLRSERQRHG
jgi:uncharacterized protein YebE (UPF0316 family)